MAGNVDSDSDSCSPLTSDCTAESTAEAMAHLTKIYIAGLLILGLFGNVYCVTAFLMPIFRRVPSTLYLAALALSDIGFLMTLGLMWMRSIGLRFLDMPHVCTGCMFLSYFCCFVSSWLVFAVTLERYFLTNGDHRGCSLGCTGSGQRTKSNSLQRHSLIPSTKHRRVRVTFSLIILCGLLINSWVIFTADSVTSVKEDHVLKGNTSDLVYSPSPAICDLSEAAADLWSYFNALDMIVSFTLPFLGVLILNAKIGFRVCKAQNLVRQQYGSAESRQGATAGCSYGNAEEESMLRRESLILLRNCADGSAIAMENLFQHAQDGSAGRASIVRQRRVRREKTERRVTQLLVTVSLAYLVLNLPSYLHRIVLAVETASGQETSGQKSSVEIVSETIAYLMFYTQFSINFFLYSCHGCMFGLSC